MPLAVTAIVLVGVVVVLVANLPAGLSTETEQPLVDEDASGLRADAGRRLHVEPELHRIPQPNHLSTAAAMMSAHA
ncbi:hypothetical protein RN607_03080 [Demequina capsici]|uniref:Uncharacterized protein n=1 Tax=Demequina capsici TaxID=3075620 RepID=A0AA96FCV8_9MICO|nr:hypothetical protein [Demequina sp. PMTSA13]WNM27999.1 hypothetical protein RN607_03080 [Demequina sp. PMTSA13]